MVDNGHGQSADAGGSRTELRDPPPPAPRSRKMDRVRGARAARARSGAVRAAWVARRGRPVAAVRAVRATWAVRVARRGQPVAAVHAAWVEPVRAGIRTALVGYAGWIAVTLALRLAGVTGRDGAAASWRQWDARWYELIAEEGYAGAAPHRGPAFFPLYPLLVRGLDTVLPGGAAVAAVAVSALAYPAFLAVLYRLVTLEYDPVTAQRTLWAVTAFPTAFFLGVGYNMSLALLLTTGAVLALRLDRWWLAGALGALATATRASAVLLLLAFAAEHVRRTGWRPGRHLRQHLGRHLLAAALVPTGLAGYAGYLWHAFGDPLAFSRAQASWGRRPDWPWAGVLEALGSVADPAIGAGLRLHDLLDPLVALAFVVLLARGVRPLALTVVGTASLLLTVSLPARGGDLPVLASTGRLALEVVAAFVALGALPLSRPVRVTLVGLSVTLQALLLGLFALGYWAG